MAGSAASRANRPRRKVGSAEVREPRDRCLEHLTGEGLAHWHGRRVIFTRDLLDTSYFEPDRSTAKQGGRAMPYVEVAPAKSYREESDISYSLDLRSFEIEFREGLSIRASRDPRSSGATKGSSYSPSQRWCRERHPGLRVGVIFPPYYLRIVSTQDILWNSA